MEIKEIVKELEYYNEELPKEALEKAIEYKEEMIPELLKMLEYTKENLENIFNEKDEFYGYIYAFFLLAEFREKRAFPYLIDLINKGEEYVEYIIGDDYPDYLHRLLASCYNGDDKLLFDIIEDKKCNEFIRSLIKGYIIKEQPTEEIKFFQREIYGIANNINQIARISNSRYSTSNDDYSYTCKRNK